MNLKERVHLPELFGKYIPDFTYELICLYDYADEQLQANQNILSAFMMLSKAQSAEDIRMIFRKLNDFPWKHLRQAQPHLLDIFTKIITVMFSGLNLPTEETEEYLSLIKEGNMSELFSNLKKVDIPALRREVYRERDQVEKDKEKVEKDKEQTRMDKEQNERRQKQLDQREAQLNHVQAALDAERQLLQEEKTKPHFTVIYRLLVSGYPIEAVRSITERPELIDKVLTIIESGTVCGEEEVWEAFKEKSISK